MYCRSLSLARSHSLVDQFVNALVLTKYAFDQGQQAASVLASTAATPSKTAPLDIEIRKDDIKFLQDLLKGELQRARAIVEIGNLRSKSGSKITTTTPLVEKLAEYPTGAVDLENLVSYPPKIELIPVKPLFFDVAWNYIDYPGKAEAAPTQVTSAQSAVQPSSAQKRGWFGFGGK